ncbi:MAG: HAMP domain-containing protein [Elusimicrobia bacterium]|nr:HAMP domain-containing protein [Elusimicrobiota bacterium]
MLGKLRARLVLVMAVSFLPAVGVIVYDHFSRQQNEILDASRKAELAVQLAAEVFEGRLESARQVLVTLSQWDPVRFDRRPELEPELRKVLVKHPHFDNIGVISIDGNLVASALEFEGPLFLGDRPYFQRVRATNAFSIGDYQVGRVTGKPSLNCAFPVHDARGRLTRVVYAAFDLSLFSPFFQGSDLNGSARIGMLNRESVLLTSVQGMGPGRRWVVPGLDPNTVTSPRSIQSKGRLVSVAPVRTRPPSGLFVMMEQELDDLFRLAHVRFFQNLAALAFSLLIAVALCGRVGNYFITRHVDRLVDTTARLTAGELGARTGVGPLPGELGQLGRAIDSMADSLQQRDRQLRESHDGLEKKVESRTRELAESNHQLESFSYSISHDLRAPLRAIDGFSQILLNEHASSLLPEGRRLLDLVVRNSKHMAQLIDDLLAFSKLGRQDVVRTDLNMSEMVREVYLDLTTPPGPVQIDFNVLPMPHARGDASMIRQVWFNLIDNALKFSSRKTQPVIEVGAKTIDHTVSFFVRDNGVGFDPARAHKLFHVFQRLHSSASFPGTGVGLAIVQRILQKHGGRVWAETTLDQGTCFYFTLPEVPL